MLTWIRHAFWRIKQFIKTQLTWNRLFENISSMIDNKIILFKHLKHRNTTNFARVLLKRFVKF